MEGDERVVQAGPVDEAILTMHRELCEKLSGVSVMLLTFGPHGVAGQLPRLNCLLNDEQMFDFFLQVLIMQHERMHQAPSNEPKH